MAENSFAAWPVSVLVVKLIRVSNCVLGDGTIDLDEKTSRSSSSDDPPTKTSVTANTSAHCRFTERWYCLGIEVNGVSEKPVTESVVGYEFIDL